VDQQSIRITQRLARALAQAEELARRLKDEYVSVEHIFAQLVEAGGALGDICRKNGIDLEKFLRASAEVRGGQRVTSADPEGTYEALTKYGRDLVEAAGKGKLDPGLIIAALLTAVMDGLGNAIRSEYKKGR
jgi:ATP-dependent Clp protease ATP-binding subunit ClpB